MTGIDTAKKLTAILISALMCFCVCACGGEDEVEETVEITTPSENSQQGNDDGKSADEDKGGDSDVTWSPESKDTGKTEKAEKKSDSPYKTIFNDYDGKMKDATKKYVDELEDMTGSTSKDDLYDETQDRIKGLEKIYDEGKDKMLDTMLKSTEDDADDYEKYFNKLTESYTEYSREITSVYTDTF